MAPVCMGGWAAALQMSGNVHVVEPGQVYRSATLAPERLAELVSRDGIASVLNLRGAEIDQAWYRAETQVLGAAHVRLRDLPLSDARPPTPQELAELVDALEHLPRPLLIHCKAGADRTGLAAALYQYLVARRPAQEAAGQLSFAYGHFPWFPSRSGAMDETFWDVVARDAEIVSAGQPADRVGALSQ